MDEDKEDRRGFRVTDRRRFAETGEPRPEPPTEVEAPVVPSDEPPAAPRPPTPEPGGSMAPEAPAEPVNFSTFVLGLSTQALMYLGEIANPVSGAGERDLVAAKQLIDILGILRKKTHGNLEPSEESLLDSILYDLRMRYVELMRSGTKEA
jgi:hypothetical protein